MSNDNEPTTDNTEESTASAGLAVTSVHKILGEFSASDGSAVLGQNNASSGTPIGIEGAVPNNTSDGYGLSTPHDARIEGDIESSSEHIFTVDGTRGLKLGPTGTDSADFTSGGNVIGGWKGNSSSGTGATIAGGGAAGSRNYGDPAGFRGQEQVANGDFSTIGGGKSNRANAKNAVVCGGEANTANSRDDFVGGGDTNYADGGTSVVAGGNRNETGAALSTICGGLNNTVTGKLSTIAGGGGQAASDFGNTIYDNYCVIGGGSANVAGDDDSNSDDLWATIPGGRENLVNGMYSFAAGYNAEAKHDGSFVWADSNPDSVTTQASDQFLIEASGGTGIGVENPETTLHVKDSVAESGGDNIGRHVVAIDNTSSSSSPVPDVLGLELSSETDPTQFNSYISFMDSTGTIGNIQGDGNGGVEFVGSLADFAEFFPKADPDTEFEDGEVVGLNDGEIVSLRGDADPDTVLVVSTAPLVTGNRPLDEGEHDEFVKLSLVGQVPVQVSGSVEHGDVLVASSDEPGTAVAREGCDGPRRQVGMALEGADAGASVLTLIGGPSPAARDASDRFERIEALEAENEQLREELAEKDERIDDLEERLAAIESQMGTTPAPADD